jgi:hypothetical protein
MAIAGGVDADTDTVEYHCARHGLAPERNDVETSKTQACRREREPPPKIPSKDILVMSGRSRMMYQNLELEPEGAICPKRSKPQALHSSPHDTLPVSITG